MMNRIGSFFMTFQMLDIKIRVKLARCRISVLNLFSKRKEKFSAGKTFAEDNIVHIIYRISDAGYPKVKLPNISNENCLKNAVKCFPIDKVDWKIICDGCSDSTMKMVRKYLPESSIIVTSLGSGAATFNYAYDIALQYQNSDIVYFLEDDYLHLKDALSVLIDGFKLKNGENDYITLYDHPDKYDTNHICYYYMKKKTHVFLGEKTHWKTAFSTTMTFASKVSTLKSDEKVWRKWTKTKHPYDFEIFLDLEKKGRSLLSPIPALSTHAEVEYLSPLIEWQKI